MPLSEYEVDWISRIKKSPVTDQVMADAKKKIERRETYINDVVKSVVANKRQQIDDAQKDLKITNEVTLDGLKGVWHAVTRQSATEMVEIPWRVTDADRENNLIRPDTEVRADLEVDTREDVGDRLDKKGYLKVEAKEIPKDKLDKLTDAYAALNEVQNHMIAQVDEDGTRLFSDEDIRRELWTPIVREGLIPDNMVPDKFSEEAIAYAGAAQMYDEKLKDFTKKSTGKENLIRNLGIAQDVFSLATAGVALGMTGMNANKIAALQQSLLDPANADKIKDINAQILALSVPSTATVMAGAVVTGGLGVAKTWAENTAKRGSDEQWWVKASEATATILIDTVTKSVTAGIAIGGSGTKNDANIVSGSVQVGLNSLRIGFSIYQVSKENDPAKRKQLLAAIGMRVADIVGNSLQIYSSSVLKAADAMPKGTVQEKEAIAATKEYAAEISQISAGVTAAIRATANGPAIYDAISNGRYKEAAALLGAGAVQAVLSGTAQDLRDLLMADKSKEEIAKMSTQQRLFAEDDGKPLERKTIEIKDSAGKVTGTRLETDDEAAKRKTDTAVELAINDEARRRNDAAKIIADMEKAMGPATKAATSGSSKKISMPVLPDSLMDRIAEQVKAETEAAAQNVATKELEKHFTPEIAKAMFDEFGTKMKGYEAMYKDAYPVSDLDGAPDDDVEKAMEAINRAIERTSELRMKVELINGVTAATAGVIAAVIPGAGAVAAAQAIAFDIYQLVKHVEQHNKWLKNMETAFRANSAYSAGIEKTLLNAEITMSKTSVKLVLDSLNLGAQVGRCFDPTGGATVAAATLTLTQALVDFGYKCHKLREISTAWDLYLDARENPGSRKRARKAIRGNSTLAKCAIAYGACIVGDPVAEEAIRRSGLTPEILKDNNDVCKQLIVYLENELPDDPSVMHVDKKARDWMPDARPLLTPVSWLQFKKAAHLSATPRLSKASLDTPAIDNLLAELAKAWGHKPSYIQARAARVKVAVKVADDEVPPPSVNGFDADALTSFAEESETILTKLVTALTAYKPMQDMLQTAHKDFGDITKTMTQLAKMNLSAATSDIAHATKAITAFEEALKKAIDDLKNAALEDAKADQKASDDNANKKEKVSA